MSEQDTSPTAENVENAAAPADDSTTTETPPGAAEQGSPTPSPATVGEAARHTGTATAEAPATQPARRAPSQPPSGNWWWGTGRRKAAVARVRIRPGSGEFIVNKRPMAEYFTEERDHKDLNTILAKTGVNGRIDIHVNVKGGGFTGQAGAILLGLGRAIRRYDETLESILRDNGFLTRDPRKVERKKYGQPGARKRFQFSKR